MPQYYVENSHEAIIPKDLFLRAQEELERRANLKAGNGLRRRVYSSKYALSSLVTCSKCGDIYRRIQYRYKGKPYAVWRCCNRVEHGPSACDAPAIREEDLQRIVVRAINQTLAKRTRVKEVIEENIKKALENNESSNSQKLEIKLKELQRKLVNLKDSDEKYNKTIDEMKEFLDEQLDTIEKFDDVLTRKLIKEITLYDDYCAIEFQSGNTIKLPR